ncbi:hypothetical protein VNO77_27718 [Canavalia gladiata]|uniref:Uncharacterized protein n=1 Tax=Canavalia gladiata TaxID=3824 RepID=A0AAN9KV61_CANGL
MDSGIGCSLGATIWKFEKQKHGRSSTTHGGDFQTASLWVSKRMIAFQTTTCPHARKTLYHTQMSEEQAWDLLLTLVQNGRAAKRRNSDRLSIDNFLCSLNWTMRSQVQSEMAMVEKIKIDVYELEKLVKCGFKVFSEPMG